MPHFNIPILLLAASLTASAAGAAMAQSDPPGMITVVAPRYPAELERRVDRALVGTEATLAQKMQIVEILETAQRETAPLRARLSETEGAMRAAMAATPEEPAMVERLQQARLKLLDGQSRRMTRALRDVAAVLEAPQRQAFFRNWDDRRGWLRG